MNYLSSSEPYDPNTSIAYSESNISSSIQIPHTLEYKSASQKLDDNSQNKKINHPENISFGTNYLFSKQNCIKKSNFNENKNTYSDDNSLDTSRSMIYSVSESFTGKDPKQRNSLFKNDDKNNDPFIHFDSTTESLPIQFVKKKFKEDSEMWNLLNATDSSPEFHFVVTNNENNSDVIFKFKSDTKHPTKCCLLI